VLFAARMPVALWYQMSFPVPVRASSGAESRTIIRRMRCQLTRRKSLFIRWAFRSLLITPEVSVIRKLQKSIFSSKADLLPGVIAPSYVPAILHRLSFEVLNGFFLESCST
jgi:hypothetical protein